MTELYTPESISPDGVYAQGRLDYAVTTNPANIVIAMTGYALMKWAWYYGLRVTIGATGIQSASAEGALLSNPGGTYAAAAQTNTLSVSINREASAKTQEISINLEGKLVYVSGAYYNGHTGPARSASTTVSIPALPTPAVPTGCSHVRNSDAQNTVSWTSKATSTNPYSHVRIERRVDSGAWAQITSIAGTSTSYVDSTCVANATYQYRVRTEYNGILSSYTAATTLTYNSPAAPGKPSVSRQTDNSIAIAFTNTGATQTLTRLQRSINGTSWADIKTINGVNVTTTTDTPGGGTFYYRVRNERDELVSAWSAASDAVVTIMPPAAPTLTAPVNNSFALVGTQPTLYWQHNSLDGSAQSAAELRYSIDGGSAWTAVNISGNTGNHMLAVVFAINTVVHWQVRTKGAHGDFGVWSSSSYYRVIQAPSVIITSPEPVITDLPLIVQWEYSDPCGVQTSASISIRKQGAAIFSRQVNGSLSSVSLPASELLPENASDYELIVTASSSSGASTTVSMVFTTAYTEPAMPIGTAELDISTASVLLTVQAGTDSGAPETVSLDICRKGKDGRLVMLVAGAPSGTGTTDTYPPLDQEVTYLFVAHSQAGAVSRYEELITIPSNGHALFNIGTRFERVVRIALDMAHDEGVEHEKEVFGTAGPTLPLVFYGQAMRQTGSVSGTTLRDAASQGCWTQGIEVADIEELMEWNTRCILRLPYKDVMAVDIAVKKSTGICQGNADVSITWERVRDDGLVI